MFVHKNNTNLFKYTLYLYILCVYGFQNFLKKVFLNIFLFAYTVFFSRKDF